MLTILEKYNKRLDKKIYELYNLFDIDILFHIEYLMIDNLNNCYNLNFDFLKL